MYTMSGGEVVLRSHFFSRPCEIEFRNKNGMGGDVQWKTREEL